MIRKGLPKTISPSTPQQRTKHAEWPPTVFVVCGEGGNVAIIPTRTVICEEKK